MMFGSIEVLPKVFECGALLAIGYNLRTSGVFRAVDGQVAVRLATYLTLPSAILQATCVHGPVSSASWLGLGVAAVCFSTQAASNWLFCMPKHKRERAVIMGAGTGLSLTLIGYPVAEAILGVRGVQALAVLELLNSAMALAASHMLTGSAGPAFPEAFKHEDGGTFRGQWRGLRKEGLGVYSYVSGARYEGEWRDNVKDGRGVYFFPKGGTYEGEWAGGVMNGVGVRTFSSGAVKAGRWRDGQLETPLELWQCANAAEGAADAALAARKVDVGGGTWRDAGALLLRHPPLWAAVIGLTLSALALPLPAALNSVSAVLAPAHRPLALLAAGMTLNVALPQPRMLADVVRLVASRAIVPLAVVGTLLALTPPQDVAVCGALAATLLAFLCPIHPEALDFTRHFRLNEALSTALISTSHMAAAPLLLLLALTAGACGLAVPSASTTAAAEATAAAAATAAALSSAAASAGAEPLATVADAASQVLAEVAPHVLAASAHNSVLPMAAFCAAAVCLLAAGVALVQRSHGDDRQVLMVYSGAAAGSGTGSGTSGDTPRPATSSTSSSSRPPSASGGSSPGSSSSSSSSSQAGSGVKPQAEGGNRRHAGSAASSAVGRCFAGSQRQLPTSGLVRTQRALRAMLPAPVRLQQTCFSKPSVAVRTVRL